jgi:hypothetical protein
VSDTSKSAEPLAESGTPPRFYGGVPASLGVSPCHIWARRSTSNSECIEPIGIAAWSLEDRLRMNISILPAIQAGVLP